MEMEGSVCLVPTRTASVGFSQVSLLLVFLFLFFCIWGGGGGGGQFNRLLTGETIQSNSNTVTSH